MPSVTYGFLGNPKALQTFTSSNYTIPAGEYAYVTASARAGGIVQIGGTNVLTTNTWAQLRVTSGAGSLIRTDSAANFAMDNGTTAEDVVAASYWVPTGVVVNISSTPAQVCVQRFDA